MVGGYQLVDLTGVEIVDSNPESTIYKNGLYNLLENCDKPVVVKGVLVRQESYDDSLGYTEEQQREFEKQSSKKYHIVDVQKVIAGEEHQEMWIISYNVYIGAVFTGTPNRVTIFVRKDDFVEGAVF